MQQQTVCHAFNCCSPTDCNVGIVRYLATDQRRAPRKVGAGFLMVESAIAECFIHFSSQVHVISCGVESFLCIEKSTTIAGNIEVQET